MRERGDNLERAQAAIDLGHYELARKEAIQALAEDPEEVWAHFTLGRSHLLLADFSEARKAAEDVICRAPDWSGGYWLLGCGWILDGDSEIDPDARIEKARLAVIQALTLGPDDPANYQLAATVEFQTADWIRTMEFTSAGLTIAPENVELARLRAQALLKLDHAKEAVVLLQDLLRRSPEDRVAHLLLAETRFAHGEYLQARIHVNEALRLNPNSSPAQELYWELVKTQHWLLRGCVRLQQLVEPLYRWYFLWVIVLLGISVPAVAWLASAKSESGAASTLTAIAPWVLGALATFPAVTGLLPLFTNVLWMWTGRDKEQRHEPSQTKWERIAVVAFLVGIPGHLALAALVESALPVAWFWTLTGAAITQGVGSRLSQAWIRRLLYALAALNLLSMLVVSLWSGVSGHAAPLVAGAIANMAISALCGAIYVDYYAKSSE